MAARARRLAGLTAVAIVIVASLASPGSPAVRTTAAPTLYVVYAMNCTFTIMDDSGTQVTSIAPGAYQVDVRTPIVFGQLPVPTGMASTDFTACRGVPMFQLTGPGVNLFTNLSAGCVSDQIFTETFQPNATYVAQDNNQPTVTRVSFTTLSSGTPAAPVANDAGGQSVAQTSQDIVGSQTSQHIGGSTSLQGTLHVSVSANGTPTLTDNGKAVSTLAAGRYMFLISGLAAKTKGSFIILGPTSKTPTILKKSTILQLASGRWTYYTNLKTIRSFRVT